MARTWAVVAGGGTGGHVVPALAIAQALVARGHPPDTIHFMGARRGIERTMVPDAGFSVTLLPGRGLPRAITVQNVVSAGALAIAVVLAVVALARRRPRVVVVVGGFASVPAGLAATMLRIPVVVHEQNVVPGAANRLVARWAKACAVTFPGTPLPRAVVTGVPVRPEILAIDGGKPGRQAARTELGLPIDAVVVVTTGGSLGSRRINDAVTGLTEVWRERDDVAVRQIVGRRDWPVVSARRQPVGPLVVQRVEFEARMHLALAAADIAVSRAGSSTVAELAIAGVPAVLVPLPIATEDHQTANARAVVEAGGAVLVPDDELTPERLAAELAPLVDDPRRRAAMVDAVATLARPDAADAVAALVVEHARP